jgi:hypothetical protein
MGQISVKGIAVGGIVDIVTSNIVAMPLALYAATRSTVLNLPQEQQAQAITNAMQTVPFLIGTGLFLGSLCSMLGGYIAARIAKRAEVLNGALSAFLCVSFSVYGMIAGTANLPSWQHAIFLPLSPSLGAAGGYLYLRRLRIRQMGGATVPGVRAG